ncbi:hypothetical protein C8Q80DRAFT_347891 [Daedaleopsis nitida]|nr:hypothetical protein C8Q80DRAFT_347891 [Daedaleopsis nitida]
MLLSSHFPSSYQGRRRSRSHAVKQRGGKSLCEALVEDHYSPCNINACENSRFCPKHGIEYRDRTREYKEASTRAHNLHSAIRKIPRNLTRFPTVQSIQPAINLVEKYLYEAECELRLRREHHLRFFARDGPDEGHRARIDITEERIYFCRQ